LESDEYAEPRWSGGGVAELDGRPKQAPLRICFFSHLPDLGGAERSLLDLVTQLIEDHGAQCTVVVPGDGPLILRLEAAGAQVIRTEYQWWCAAEEVSEGEARSRLSDSFARLREEILPLLEDLEPDVICTQTIVVPYGAWAAAEFGKPHIWNLREYGEAGGLRFFFPFEDIVSFIRRSSDFIFGANRTLCTELMPELRSEMHDVLYPQIEIPSNTGAEKRVWPCCGNGFVLGEFATIMPHKELATVIEAVAELCRAGRSVELRLVGDQESGYVSHLEALIANLGVQDHVYLEAFMENVFPAMSAVDAVVISAPVHALGRTAIEGMLLGKPVIYPLGTGFDDYVEDGVTGLGYAARDPHAMADRIDLLIRSPGLGRELGGRAQASARATFTRDGFGGKFYRQALTLRDRPVIPKTKVIPFWL